MLHLLMASTHACLPGILPCQADKVGPGLALKLDEGEEVTAASAPLSEEGFHDVVLMQDHLAVVWQTSCLGQAVSTMENCACWRK